MTKITYLLGAGASHKAIPIVSELEERINYHIQFLPLYHKRSDNLEGYIEALKKLTPHLHHYTSIDTYAKFLKLKREDTKYEQLKNALTMFFMLEQFVDLAFDPVNNPEDKAAVEINLRLDELNYSYKSKSFKKYRLDPRYNNFVVSLMNEPVWPSNVKVLSWNYDFQLEMACNSIYPGLLKYYPSKAPEEKSTEPQLVHLNGIAGISENRELILDGDQERTFEKVISHWSDLQSGRGYKQFLKFAWEQRFDLHLVEKHLRETEILVVIGYSFPFFNRDIDSRLFQIMYLEGKLRKIYFQNAELDGQFLYEQFEIKKPPKSYDESSSEFLLGELSKNVIIKQYNNLDRFYIPNEYKEPLLHNADDIPA